MPRGRSWREADIPTNGIKAVAAEPGGADEFADRGVVRELADELGFDRRPLRASRGWRRSALTDDRPDAGGSSECQRGMKSPRLRLSHRPKGYAAQEAPENGDWQEQWQKPAAGEEQKAERRDRRRIRRDAKNLGRGPATSL